MHESAQVGGKLQLRDIGAVGKNTGSRHSSGRRFNDDPARGAIVRRRRM